MFNLCSYCGEDEDCGKCKCHAVMKLGRWAEKYKGVIRERLESAAEITAGNGIEALALEEMPK